MTKKEAENMLFEMQKAVGETHGCVDCPFCDVVVNSDICCCPFEICPELWEIGA